jgi:hypothetical protein
MNYGVWILFLVPCIVCAMENKIQNIRDKNAVLWHQYVPKVSEIVCNNRLIVPAIINNPQYILHYSARYIFSVRYKKNSNNELCIEKVEIVRSKTPDYQFNIFHCKWDTVYAGCESKAWYLSDTSSGNLVSCHRNLYALLAQEYRDTSLQAGIIRSLCAKLAQQRNICFASQKCYALSDDLSRVACISDQGVIYVFSPGAELNSHKPVGFQDISFNFK